jgi:hypothetical protein
VPGRTGRRSQPPTDWVSGERVFAPPAGTLDVDWLVPALLEAVPSATPAQARAALVAAAAGAAPDHDADADHRDLAVAAGRVVAEARRSFRA